METKDREPDNQRFKEPVYGIRRTDQTKEGAVFKKAEEDYINRNCFLNKDLSVQILNEIKTGFAKSVNDKGELILETKENKDIVLTIGDIL